jgi:hypothetical protein
MKNMKKTYLNPEISQLLSLTEDMIATSNPEGFNENLDNNSTITPEDMLSRQNIWGEDED